MSTQPNEPPQIIKIFISYAHADQQLCMNLVEHLSSLERSGKITIWLDQEISAGANWNAEIDTRLKEADLILLLVSSSFMRSDYCWNKELPAALEQHETRTVQVIPIILRPVDWQNTPLAQFQVLPKEAKAITAWDNQDAAFENVVRDIRRVVDRLLRGDTDGKEKIIELFDKVRANIHSTIPNVKKIANRRVFLSTLAAVIIGLLTWDDLYQRMVESEQQQQMREQLAQQQRIIQHLQSTQHLQLTQLRMGLLPQSGDKEINSTQYSSLDDHLQQKLKIPVVSNSANAYIDTVKDLAQGKIEVAWLGAYSYLKAIEMCQPKLLLYRLNKGGSDSYYSYIITSKTSGINSLQDLKGKSFYSPDEYSTSGYLVPKCIFKKQNIDLGHDVPVKTNESYSSVVDAVLKGSISAGAISSDAYAALPADQQGMIHILNQEDNAYRIPTGPIVLRKDIQDYDVLQIHNAFLSVAADYPLSTYTLNIQGFKDVYDDTYEIVRGWVKEAGLLGSLVG